ncbi:MAG: TetR/AcrR family transcriptional regulator [Lentisphaeria bacterium]|jgi:AcrR family transcriptional regulator
MRKTEAKRRQIMSAAESLFAAQRYDEITMDAVARTAAVGKGTIYRYFASKEALLLAIVESAREDLLQAVLEASQEPGDFHCALLTTCRRIVAFHEQRHHILQQVFLIGKRLAGKNKGEFHRRWHEDYRRLLQAFAQVFERGIAAGVMREGMKAETLAGILLNQLYGWGAMRMHGRNSDLSLEGLVELFCLGAYRRGNDELPEQAQS